MDRAFTCLPALASIAFITLTQASPADVSLQWPTPAGDVANTRFSELSAITPDNVRQLTLAFAFSTGTPNSAGLGFERARGSATRGLIMWVPGSLVYVGVALALLVRWIRASDFQADRRVC